MKYLSILILISVLGCRPSYSQQDKDCSIVEINKSKAEWQKTLSPEAYYITQEAGTERPFTGKYWNNKKEGTYTCIACDLDLFDSKTKFKSGTGWPSYWQPINECNVSVATDNTLGMSRDEVFCTRCKAHLGHVFNDGPKPTGLRYCMNSAALNFKQKK